MKKITAWVLLVGWVFWSSPVCAAYGDTDPSAVRASDMDSSSAGLLEPAPGSSQVGVIQTGDKLNIQVYQEKDLSGTFVVDANGNINYYILGEIHVEGLTIDELKAFLTDTLGQNYLVNPQVQIEYAESPNKSVSMLGQVVRPGNYMLQGNDTLIKLISQVGGFAPDASQTVKLLRASKDGLSKQFIELDVTKITRGEAPDYALQPGDVIFVEKKSEDTKKVISILGQITRPGNYTFTPGLTLVRLISEAGGFTALAVQNRVKIIRHPDNAPESSLVANVAAILDGKEKDMPLEAGDVVVVAESFF